jgi:hypothetical protein
MNKVSKVVTIMGVAVMLLGFNATAGSLLGGDRYDKDGNCFKSGVRGDVPCKTAVSLSETFCSFDYCES